jgi:butyryl-CoA dehydrogenase
MESAALRAQKLAEKRGEAAANAIAMTQTYIAKGMETIEAAAKKVIAAVADGDMLRTQLAILRRLTKYDLYNTIALRRHIAGKVLETGKYVVA